MSKKDKTLYSQVINKINEVINSENPEHYKNLRNDIISKYNEDCIDLEVNPEYIDKLLEIDQEPGIKFKTIDELRQIIESD